jgi:glycosyltransferase involved in cell wall biosynthesis
MRVALFSSYIPFVHGGARFIVEWLEQKLLEYGHQVERVYLPFSDHAREMLRQMIAYRSLKIDAADKVICFRPPAHLLQHPNKVLWFIHHFRGFYDLWGINGSPPETGYNIGLRRAIFHADAIGLNEARVIFANSRVVQKRLKDFNNVDSYVLYPPLLTPAAYRNTGYGDEVVYLSRLVSHKRQRLLVQAMAHVKTDIKARICGEDLDGKYAEELINLASSLGLGDRIIIENRWVSEQEKCDIIGRCLAVAYFPLDEDSYGYPTLEAAHSNKPILTTTDSGGVLEFVTHGRNGLVCDSNAEAIAELLDRLYSNRALAEALGKEANKTIRELRIDWDNVLDHLLD